MLRKVLWLKYKYIHDNSPPSVIPAFKYKGIFKMKKECKLTHDYKTYLYLCPAPSLAVTLLATPLAEVAPATCFP